MLANLGWDPPEGEPLAVNECKPL